MIVPETRLFITIKKMLDGEDLTTTDLGFFTQFMLNARINVVGSNQEAGLQAFENFRNSLHAMLEMTKHANQK